MYQRKYPFILEFLGLIATIACVGGISIDGQLTVIRNDCYERMTIGEKLSYKQTYKTFDHNTVSKCEKECTQEKEKCRAYSFGIGPKGNATCLLSRNPIKETADLKPIGTISDTDYDLYIKKLDCQVVLEPPQNHPPEPLANKPDNSGGIHPPKDQPHESGYGVQEHHGDHVEQNLHYGNVPAQSNYHSSVSNPNQGFDPGYHYHKPDNSYPSAPRPPPSNGPPKGDGLQHIQTVVSIASGPHSILHPVHDILISEDAYHEGKPHISPSGGDGYGAMDGNMPPFRPPALNHPYDHHRPQLPLQRPERPPVQDYESIHRPNPDYGNVRPIVSTSATFGYGHGYGYGGQSSEYFSGKPMATYPNDLNTPYRPNPPSPHPNDDRPDPDYGPRPPKLPESGYGSGGTQLMIDRRKYESFNQFNSYESEFHKFGPEQPKRYDPNYNFYDHYEKPSSNFPNRYGSVIPHPNDYNRPDPHYDYLFVRPNSDPYRPTSESDRPGYNNQRPLNSLENSGYDKPERPLGPRPEYDGLRPSHTGGNSGYDRPDRPLRPTPIEHEVPRPLDTGSSLGYDRPEGFSRPRPEYDARRPLDKDNGSGYDRPDNNERPLPGYDDRRPVKGGGQGYDKPLRPDPASNNIPSNSYNQPTSPYPPKRPSSTSSSRPPSTELSNHYGGVDYTNKQYGKPGEYYNGKGDGGDQKVIAQSVGYHGEKITSIITELKNGELLFYRSGKNESWVPNINATDKGGTTHSKTFK